MHKLISDKLFKAIPALGSSTAFQLRTMQKALLKRQGLNPETAYVMGLLHDIGRGAGVSGIRHIFDGYDLMTSIGEPEIARIA